MRALVPLLLLALTTIATASTRTYRGLANGQPVAVLLKDGGKLEVRSKTVHAFGTWRQSGDRLTLSLSKRNGAKPVSASESGGTALLSKDSKSLTLVMPGNHRVVLRRVN